MRSNERAEERKMTKQVLDVKIPWTPTQQEGCELPFYQTTAVYSESDA